MNSINYHRLSDICPMWLGPQPLKMYLCFKNNCTAPIYDICKAHGFDLHKLEQEESNGVSSAEDEDMEVPKNQTRGLPPPTKRVKVVPLKVSAVLKSKKKVTPILHGGMKKAASKLQGNDSVCGRAVHVDYNENPFLEVPIAIGDLGKEQRALSLGGGGSNRQSDNAVGPISDAKTTHWCQHLETTSESGCVAGLLVQ